MLITSWRVPVQVWPSADSHYPNHTNWLSVKMNIEDYREYCLSLGADVEEKLPFQKFKNGEGVLVFYVMGHMFSFFDCNDFSVISLKYHPIGVKVGLNKYVSCLIIEKDGTALLLFRHPGTAKWPYSRKAKTIHALWT